MGKRATPGIALHLTLRGLLLVTLGAAAAPEDAPAEQASKLNWDLRLGLDLRYDDNILQLSDRHIDRLENPRPGDETDNRFSIETPDDLVSTPHLSSALKVDWVGDRATVFDLDVSAYQYLENEIKDYVSFRAAVSQPLHRGNRHPTSIEISWSRIPDFYLRNLISGRASEELVILDVRKEATFRKTVAQIEVEQEIITDQLRFRAAAGAERRDYNRYFDERDSRMPFREARLSWDPLGEPRLRFRISYRREDLRAHGDLSDTLVYVEDDVSSRRDIVAADARWQWGKKGRRKSLRLSYEIENRDYATTDRNDLDRFGRDDRRRNADLMFQIDLRKGWFLRAEAERLRNRSDIPAPPGGSEPDDFTDFTNDLLSIGFGYEFDLAPRRRDLLLPRRERLPRRTRARGV